MCSKSTLVYEWAAGLSTMVEPGGGLAGDQTGTGDTQDRGVGVGVARSALWAWPLAHYTQCQ